MKRESHIKNENKGNGLFFYALFTLLIVCIVHRLLHEMKED
jgi:hypothetical protein